VTKNTPNDDMIAINADDDIHRVVNLGMKRGPIRDIQINDLSASNAYTFVRLLSTTSFIENITIQNVSGGCRYYAVNINNWKFPVGSGNIQNITLKDFNVSKSVVPDPQCLALIKIALKVKNLQINNFLRRKDTSLDALTLSVKNDTKNVLMFKGLDEGQLKDIIKDSTKIEPEISKFAKFTIESTGEFILRNGSIYNLFLTRN
ncbi:unnamed protein product, partial [marine sediment metagenome]